MRTIARREDRSPVYPELQACRCRRSSGSTYPPPRAVPRVLQAPHCRGRAERTPWRGRVAPEASLQFRRARRRPRWHQPQIPACPCRIRARRRMTGSVDERDKRQRRAKRQWGPPFSSWHCAQVRRAGPGRQARLRTRLSTRAFERRNRAYLADRGCAPGRVRAARAPRRRVRRAAPGRRPIRPWQ